MSWGVVLNRRSFADLQKSLEKFGKRGKEAMSKAVETATINCQTDAVRNAPSDTGRLRQSIHNLINRVGKIEGIVYSDVVYAPYVELGTRPHFPPPGALEGWARRHGLSGKEFVIARGIFKNGTPPTNFMGRAFEKNAERMKEYAEAEVRKAISEVAR